MFRFMRNENKSTGNYRSKDSKENFRIRVTLRKVHGMNSISFPKFSENEAEMQNFGSSDNDSVTNVKEISWQEKIFSKDELEFYNKKSNCQSNLDFKFHEEVNKLHHLNEFGSKIFTHIHSEMDVFNKKSQAVVTKDEVEPNFLAHRIDEIQKKSKIFKASNEGSGKVFSNVSIVDQNPNSETMKYSHVLSTPVQSMYIMADFKQPGDESKSDCTFLLCEISINSKNVTTITPDFNHELDEPYTFEYNNNGIKETYFYTLEHISKDITEEDKAQEEKFHKELLTHNTEVIASTIGSSFEMPSPGILTVLVYGEIISAKYFDYDNLYIHYFLDLLDGWSLIGDSKAFNVTQVSKTTTVGNEDIAHFCFPFEFELKYKIDRIDSNEDDSVPKWPVLYLEVISSDTWGTYRTEGYGYLNLPNTPGCFYKQINTWRPMSSSNVGEMRRFFIGGSPQLNDITYSAIPSSLDDKKLSKLGFKTATSGCVDLRMNIIHQSQAYLSSESHRRKMGNLIEKLGAATIHSGISAVLVAFQRARQRMIAARKNTSTR